MMSNPEASGPALSIRHTGQVFPLTQGPVTIGRMADNVLVLSDSLVSRHHATISWQAGAHVIQDLGSANGTYVNERRITAPEELRHGYVVRMGNTILDVQLAPSADAWGQEPAAAGVTSPAAGFFRSDLAACSRCRVRAGKRFQS
jgi:pSer/pThr/pTyr-binding forkhead associated (FHA) protein